MLPAVVESTTENIKVKIELLQFILSRNQVILRRNMYI